MIFVFKIVLVCVDLMILGEIYTQKGFGYPRLLHQVPYYLIFYGCWAGGGGWGCKLGPVGNRDCVIGKPQKGPEPLPEVGKISYF